MRQALTRHLLPMLAVAFAIGAILSTAPPNAQAGTNVEAPGVPSATATSGGSFAVTVPGLAIVEPGTAFAAGDTMQINADRKAVVWAAPGAKYSVAMQTIGTAMQRVDGFSPRAPPGLSI